MNVLTKTTNSSPQRNFPLSLLKGAAVNIGLQALSRNLSKDNFWQTLLVGAAGGIGNYLGGNTAMGAVLGGGNAIINKSHFAGTTAKYAAWGAFADLVMKVAVAKAEPEKWDLVEEYSLPNGDLKPHSQRGDREGCAQATLDSIAEYLGKKVVTAYYNIGYDFTDLAKENGIVAYDLAKKSVGDKKINIPLEVGNYLRMGFPAALTYNNDGIQHIVGVNKIEKERKMVTDKQGVVSEKIRWRVEVMNPVGDGIMDYIPISALENGLVSIVKP